MHAMVLSMCHTHYTPTQPETPGLIDNTLPNKNLKQMLWMTFSLIYSMANRQCQLWAGIFVVNPALKLKTTHAHRRYLYAGECCRRETSGQCCSNAEPSSSMVTYIGPASVWRLVLASANPVLHPDLTHSILLCSYPAGCGAFIYVLSLSVCPGK